jgi:hypothetical protein
VRDGLDEIVDDVIDKLINPEKWQEETEERGNGKQARAGICAGGS